MLIVVIGGAGKLGTHTVPHLARRHQVRVLDPRPATVAGAESFTGDVRSPEDVAAVVAGADAVVHMGAVVPRLDHPDPAEVQAAFAVNTASIHLAMTSSAAAGVRSFVHISTMSVFERYAQVTVYPAAQPDARSPYGLTKRLGEQVCAALDPGLHIAACSLRLIFPTPDDEWPQWCAPGDPRPPRTMTMRDGRAIPGLATSDLAAAIEAAAGYTGPYRPFSVTADVAGVSVQPDDTHDVLGWRPARVPDAAHGVVAD